ncbi:ferredoxin--NAD(+) reductase [Methylobacterium sp. Leaf466]|uniref:ferredoxin--NAD(+) reductase n=1 Tax=Methylobacterium sp. Leaf466 TaxID=1736386 RepID=UPI0006FA77E6|nr:ferredoxin--NAD(+) reductase [Methylobacterium sp. Leaf466]KQT90392.1 ferredoxin-NAD reductase [Methylobacterium sp. Leaf466]
MSARCSLVVNGKAVRISTGETPVEAALAEGMIGSGLNGAAAFGQGGGPAARRAKPRGHRAESLVPSLPRTAPTLCATPALQAGAPVRRSGTITDIRPLGPHVVEMVVTVTRRLDIQPGHQVVVTIHGHEPLTLSPTLRIDGAAELNELVFHLPLHPGEACLASALGETVPRGTDVKIEGPVGRGFYRPGGGRLVLVAAETGFAPIWSIARAARYIEPARDVVLVAGARDPLDLYMRPSLDWLRATGIGRIVLVADRSRQRPPDVRPGPLSAHLPPLRTTDVVHVVGDASTVGAVEVLAAAAGARCYPVLLAP